MNPIEIIKIKNVLSSCNIKNYKINDDKSVDVFDEYMLLDIGCIHEYYPEIDLNNFELPFKFNTMRKFQVTANRYYPCIFCLKSCRNFPNHCKSLIIDPVISVRSLKGLETIENVLYVNFIDWKKYNYSYDIQKDYPDLNIGSEIQFFNKHFETLKTIIFDRWKIK